MREPRLDLLIDVEAGDWPPEADLQDLAGRVLNHAAHFLADEEGQPFGVAPVEVSIVFSSDAAMRLVNKEWRGQDKPTNVLSFPAYPIRPGAMPGPMLGDIVLARETIAREAGEMGVGFDEHLSHLLVHGFLHLFGHDHMDDEEAAIMESLETRILAQLGISDPYGHDDPA